jgi:hypothetical protein
VFRRDSGQLSERSDAGTLMVGQVIGFVRRNDPERTGGSGSRRAMEVRGKGAATPLPCPALQNPRSALALRSGGFGLTDGFAAHLME